MKYLICLLFVISSNVYAAPPTTFPEVYEEFLVVAAEFKDLEFRAASNIAAFGAMASIPQSEEGSVVGVGMASSYRSDPAIAIGYSHSGEKGVLKAAMAVTPSGMLFDEKIVFQIGYGWKF